MLSSSSSVSEAGSKVKPPSAVPVVRLVAGAERRTPSISSPKKARRHPPLSPAGKRATRPPRTANAPPPSAADGELSRVGDGVGADVAVGLEEGGEAMEVDPLPRHEPRDELAHAKRRQRALGGGVDGGDEELRLVRLALQRMQGGQSLGRR